MTGSYAALKSRVRARLRAATRRIASKTWVRAHLRYGRIPWSRGYGARKMTVIRSALRNTAVMECFREGRPLPPGYGERLDERAVEYPWALSRVGAGPGRVLDAGSALNYEEILNLPLWREKAVHVVTLSPEPRCYWGRGISYLFADLRCLPIRDDFYDEIVCISTLEHVGLDNSQYARGAVETSGDFTGAVRELQRVLKTGGVLRATVPYGRRMVLSWLQQFDQNLVDRLIDTFRPASSRLDFYSYSAGGWNVSDARSSSDAEYFDIRTARAFDEDYAAAARAVACLELRK